MKHSGAQAFPSTRLSLLQQLHASEENTRSAAFGVLASLYWMPVYKYVRLKWHKNSEDSKDLTQAFFALALEKGFFEGYDSSKARFRTFLRTCLDAFAANERKAEKAQKRGGQMIHVDVDWLAAERELSQLHEKETPESIFEKEWIRSVFRLSLEEYRQQAEKNGKFLNYLLLLRYDIESDGNPSYKALAKEFEIPVSQVTNCLAEARRQLRKIVLETLQKSTASKEEFQNEARAVLGLKSE
jgi:RNA polymerase sigma factor (sigma-70 family)